MSRTEVQQPTPATRRALPGHQVELGRETPLRLDCGVELGPFTMAYQTHGRLNDDRSNAILVCHALTGDQFVADTLQDGLALLQGRARPEGKGRARRGDGFARLIRRGPGIEPDGLVQVRGIGVLVDVDALDPTAGNEVAMNLVGQG